MTDADVIYFWSPWSLPLILGVVFFLGVFLMALYRRRELQQKSETRWVFALFGGLGFVAVGLALMISRATQSSGPRLVIHRDYLACGSWTHDKRKMRVPWYSFVHIGRQRRGRLFLEVVLHFDLDPRYAREVPWTDWVQSNGWVNCEISGLTDNPRRIGFATDTSEIQAKVEAAWRAALNRHASAPRPPVSYHDLMSQPPNSLQP
jgi:hypothetical protein